MGDRLRLRLKSCSTHGRRYARGFQGNDRLIIHRAAVQDVYDAMGLDIFGSKPATRQV